MLADERIPDISHDVIVHEAEVLAVEQSDMLLGSFAAEEILSTTPA